MEGRAAKAQGSGQGPAARLAASGTLLQSDRSNGPSSPATPPGFGGLNAPGEPDMPPGFGPMLSARTCNLNEVFGDR